MADVLTIRYGAGTRTVTVDSKGETRTFDRNALTLEQDKKLRRMIRDLVALSRQR